MLKITLKIERKTTLFELDPKKWANLMEKEKVKLLWGENFKDFAISNGIEAMAILLILFCM